MKNAESYQKRLQRTLSRQVKGSNRRKIVQRRLNKQCKSMSNIRNDFLHKISRMIVDSDHKVFVFENLKIRNMTKKPKAKQDENGKFLPNKAQRLGNVSFKVSPHFTRQKCANCSHTHANNRKSQYVFKCENCGHIDNADRNTANGN